MNSAAAVLQGPRLHLRPIAPTDVTERYCAWLNDPEVNRFLEVRFRPQTMDSVRDFVKAAIADPDQDFRAICVNETSWHIGNIKLGPINRAHGFADLGYLIGEKMCWGRGYAQEAIRLMARHAFETHRLRKICAGAYATAEASINALEKCGFTREGLLQQHYILDGQPTDGLLFGLLAEDFKP